MTGRETEMSGIERRRNADRAASVDAAGASSAAAIPLLSAIRFQKRHNPFHCAVQASLLAGCLLSSVSVAQEKLADRIAHHPVQPAFANGQDQGEAVEYRSGSKALKGILYMPPGPGLFAAMLFNHGADKHPGPQPELARFYTEHGIVFFVPYRTGHGANQGMTIKERMLPSSPENTGDLAADARFVALLDEERKDVAAAVAWLRTNDRIDNKRIYMSGISYGGLHTILLAQTIHGLRGCVVFSGGARLWDNPLLRKRLIDAVEQAGTPMFLIEAENDYGLGPIKGLGPILERKGKPNRVMLYPSFGDPGNSTMGHVAFSTWDLGAEIWGPDVLKFIEDTVTVGTK
jgi:dienelactone hydrolase